MAGAPRLRHPRSRSRADADARRPLRRRGRPGRPPITGSRPVAVHAHPTLETVIAVARGPARRRAGRAGAARLRPGRTAAHPHRQPGDPPADPARGRVPDHPVRDGADRDDRPAVAAPRRRSRADPLHQRHHRPAEGRGDLGRGDRRRPGRAGRTPGSGRPTTSSCTACRCTTCTGWCSACSGRCASAAGSCTPAGRCRPATPPPAGRCTSASPRSGRGWSRTRRARGPCARRGCWSPVRRRCRRRSSPALHALTGHAPVERYGMTETLITVSARADGPRRPGHVGTALPGVETRVACRGTGEAVGELQVRGRRSSTATCDGRRRPRPRSRGRLVPHRRRGDDRRDRARTASSAGCGAT